MFNFITKVFNKNAEQKIPEGKSFLYAYSRQTQKREKNTSLTYEQNKIEEKSSRTTKPFKMEGMQSHKV